MNKKAKLGMAKRALAIAMAAAMTISSVPVQAAAKPALSTFTKATTVNRYGNTTKTITLKNVKTLAKGTKVTWAAVDAKGKKSTVATISATTSRSAKITYKKAGTVYFTAKFKAKGASKYTTLKTKKVTIKQGSTGVQLLNADGTKATNMTLATGSTVQFKSLVLPAASGKTKVTASGQTKVTYSLSAEGAAYASITQAGKLTINEDVGIGDKTFKVILKGHTSTASYPRTTEITVTVTGAEEVKVPEVASIKEVKQTGAKTVEVTFDKAVAVDTAITVTKEGLPVSLAAEGGVVLNADGLSAVLTTVSDIESTDYTFVASGTGVSTEAKTVKLEKAVLTTIETTRDTAILDANIATQASFTFVCKDQFGNAVAMPSTAKISVSVSEESNITTTAGTSENGFVNTVTFKWNDGVINVLGLNNTVVVSIIDTASAKSLVGKILTVSNKRALESITAGPVLDADGKVTTIKEGSDFAKNKQYVCFEAKDQYGDPVSTAIMASSASVTVTMPTLAVDTLTPTTLKGADGKTYIAYQITSATANAIGLTINPSLMVVSLTNGKTANVEVPVAYASKLKTLEITDIIGAKDLKGQIIAKEEYRLAVVAKDMDGNVITDDKVLNASATGLSSYAEVKFEKQADGTMALVCSPAAASITTLTLSPTNNPAGIVVKQYPTKDAAVVSTVTGLKSTVDTTIVANQNVELNAGDFNIVDQYGRTVAVSDNTTTAAVTGAYYIQLVTPAATQFTVTAGGVAVSTAAITSGASATLFASGSSATLGSESIKFDLMKCSANGLPFVKAGDTIEVKFTRTSASEFKSYEVALGSDKIWAATDSAIVTDYNAYGTTVKLYGVLENGKKALLPTGDYELIAPTTNIKIVGGIVTASAAMFTDKDNAKEEKTVTLQFVTKDGTLVTKDVTVYEEAPVVTTLEVNKDNKFVSVEEDGSIAITTNAAGLVSAAALTSSASAFLDGKAPIIVKDQFGNTVKMDESSIANILITNFGEATPSANGTANAGIDLANEQKATIKIVLTNGNSVTVIVKCVEVATH